jgi:hypothetical protein
MTIPFDKDRDIEFFRKSADAIIQKPHLPTHLSQDTQIFPNITIQHNARGPGPFTDDITGGFVSGTTGIIIAFPSSRLPLHIKQNPQERDAIRFYFGAAIAHETIHFRQDRDPAFQNIIMPKCSISTMDPPELLEQYYMNARELDAHACQIALLLTFQPPRAAPLHPVTSQEVFATAVGRRIDRYLGPVSKDPAKLDFEKTLTEQVNRWMIHFIE